MNINHFVQSKQKIFSQQLSFMISLFDALSYIKAI